MTWWVGLVDFSGESEVQSNGRCVSRYMRKYLVRTDAPVMQNEVQVAAAVGITRGSSIDFDINAICRKISIGPGPAMTRPPFMAYYATYEFSTDTPAPADDDDDPTTTRTIWSISPQIQSRYVIKDRDGKLIVNKAGDPYDGGIPVDVRLGSVTARRNIDASGYDKDSVLANSGKLNSSTFLGGEPGTVQVDISANEKYEGGYHYWEETYTFSYDPQGWQPKPVNAGFRQRLTGDSGDPDYNKRVRITENDVNEDSDTTPVQEPEPLDDNGVVIYFTDRPDACTFIDVDYFYEMDFSDFSL